MGTNISIIGLGQIGSSVGLALQKHPDQIQRIGFDFNPAVTKEAKNNGVIDQGVNRVVQAVRETDIILLALPTDEIREILEIISTEIKESAVLIDFAPVKMAVSSWTRDILNESISYVGLTPVINPRYLDINAEESNTPHEDLFKNTVMALTAPTGTKSEAIQVATNLINFLGASPIFSDSFEIDGLMSSCQILPQLISAALLNATTNQPGWRESRKFAGREYAMVTEPMSQARGSGALADESINNHENVTRVLNDAISALLDLRDDITNQDRDALEKRLKSAIESREKWWVERNSANWQREEFPKLDVPAGHNFFGSLLGSRRKSIKKTDKE